MPDRFEILGNRNPVTPTTRGPQTRFDFSNLTNTLTQVGARKAKEAKQRTAKAEFDRNAREARKRIEDTGDPSSAIDPEQQQQFSLFRQEVIDAQVEGQRQAFAAETRSDFERQIILQANSDTFQNNPEAYREMAMSELVKLQEQTEADPLTQGALTETDYQVLQNSIDKNAARLTASKIKRDNDRAATVIRNGVDDVLDNHFQSASQFEYIPGTDNIAVLKEEGGAAKDEMIIYLEEHAQTLSEDEVQRYVNSHDDEYILQALKFSGMVQAMSSEELESTAKAIKSDTVFDDQRYKDAALQALRVGKERLKRQEKEATFLIQNTHSTLNRGRGRLGFEGVPSSDQIDQAYSLLKASGANTPRIDAQYNDIYEVGSRVTDVKRIPFKDLESISLGNVITSESRAALDNLRTVEEQVRSEAVTSGNPAGYVFDHHGGSVSEDPVAIINQSLTASAFDNATVFIDQVSDRLAINLGDIDRLTRDIVPIANTPFDPVPDQWADSLSEAIDRAVQNDDPGLAVLYARSYREAVRKGVPGYLPHAFEKFGDSGAVLELATRFEEIGTPEAVEGARQLIEGFLREPSQATIQLVKQSTALNSNDLMLSIARGRGADGQGTKNIKKINALAPEGTRQREQLQDAFMVVVERGLAAAALSTGGDIENNARTIKSIVDRRIGSLLDLLPDTVDIGSASLYIPGNYSEDRIDDVRDFLTVPSIITRMSGDNLRAVNLFQNGTGSVSSFEDVLLSVIPEVFHTSEGTKIRFRNKFAPGQSSKEYLQIDGQDVVFEVR